ncbi:MAG: hypothetical protein RMK29_13645 [Myxococcales bacterium]|nr:hypothetical protein [Myxococcales bacterium]
MSAFVDHIEWSSERDRGRARLLVRDSAQGIVEGSFPAAWLPEGAREGTWVKLQIQLIDPPPGEDPTDLRRSLGEGDPGGDIRL